MSYQCDQPIWWTHSNLWMPPTVNFRSPEVATHKRDSHMYSLDIGECRGVIVVAQGGPQPDDWFNHKSGLENLLLEATTSPSTRCVIYTIWFHGHASIRKPISYVIYDVCHCPSNMFHWPRLLVDYCFREVAGRHIICLLI